VAYTLLFSKRFLTNQGTTELNQENIMSSRLEGKVAVITGAASGIGEASARRFVEEGCKVVLGDIQVDVGQALAKELGAGVVFGKCNVTKEQDVSDLIDLAVKEFGQLDIMFNNAGIVGAIGPIDTTIDEEWSATLAVLLNGVFYGMKHASRVMKKQKSGSIISMSSVAGLTGGLGPHAYAAAKHAVVGLTQNVSAELCSYGIRVNAIAPYSVATSMVADAYLHDHKAIDETTKMLTDESPLVGRPGLATDVANAALWLASDEAGYTSGHTLTVDAGITTGAIPGGPRFNEYSPMQREAGKSGL
jgi:NAD(P)-dependent dehydrogenase (short-subunit alcohol dehydrogenase family)